jgi:hypothetical protein
MPTSFTTPARSEPWPEGKVAGQRSCSRTFADRGLAGIDPGRLDLDQDVFFAQLGEFDLADREDVEAPVLVELDRAWHEPKSTHPRSA